MYDASYEQKAQALNRVSAPKLMGNWVTIATSNSYKRKTSL